MKRIWAWITGVGTLLFIALVFILLTAISISLMLSGWKIMDVNVGAVLLTFIAAYFVFSFGSVRGNEVGVMTKFGEPIRNLGKGLYFAPLGIFSVIKFPGTIIEDELPGPPEKIHRDPFKEDQDVTPEKVPEGMFPPIRVKFGSPKPDDTEELKKDAYNIAMVAEVPPVISWQITNPMMFWETVGDVENCRKIMEDRAVALFGAEFAKITPAKAALNLTETSQKLKKLLMEETKNLGITIIDALVKPFVFSHKLNRAVINVVVEERNARAREIDAVGKANATKTIAAAERYRLLQVGLAKLDGENMVLVPDANVLAQTDAIKELAKTTGTLVLGDLLKPVLPVGHQTHSTEEKTVVEEGETKTEKKHIKEEKKQDSGKHHH
jgi:regulator of protease activity HflC (stomatin/prohibitin superfamily)